MGSVFSNLFTRSHSIVVMNHLNETFQIKNETQNDYYYHHHHHIANLSSQLTQDQSKCTDI